MVEGGCIDIRQMMPWPLWVSMSLMVVVVVVVSCRCRCSVGRVGENECCASGAASRGVPEPVVQTTTFSQHRHLFMDGKQWILSYVCG